MFYFSYMEAELTRISEKGQIVIPASLRKTMKINKSDRFLVFEKDGIIILKRITDSDLWKDFEKIAKPIIKSAKLAKFSKKDLRTEINASRHAQHSS